MSYALRGLHGIPPIGTREAVAITMIFGGLVSTAGIVLYAKGRTKEAAMLAISGTVVGSFVGAARYYGGPA